MVEEKLPQGALGWQEVAAVYHFRSQEGVLRDHEDIKCYWAEKLGISLRSQLVTQMIQ